MTYSNIPSKAALKSIQDVSHIPFWLDDPNPPQPEPELTRELFTELLIIGGGFTGLWTALQAREENPSREIILLEAEEIASGASRRNGGFVDESITHGLQNGLARWPEEYPTLLALGMKNLDSIEATIRYLNIDCDYLRVGDVSLASEQYQLEDLQEEIEIAKRFNIEFEFYDHERVQEIIKSPFFIGALNHPRTSALVNPAQLAWGLRKACLDLGVQIYEHSPVTKLDEENSFVIAQTPHGRVRASCVALATNAYPPLLKRLTHYVVPVYDYALMTEPLTTAQRESIGWRGREGISDASLQFHYSRTTVDGRILWGGYDAVYYWNNGFGSELEKSSLMFERLATHFFQAFPQLEGLRFSHAWGGAIDTCSRFSPFWGTTHHRKTVYVMGYTGLGVGASRFGARVMIDLLDHKQTERTALKMVRTKPLPFPPEPFRSIGINITRWSMDQADRNQGRENLWLRAMGWLGLGFDS
ncbi:MAG TPA: FAD-dependent oxidoreductase [Anaerolineales bacterium]|nr:FAD-dependent oxidoreductase [Anaerolineales bacterium]